MKYYRVYKNSSYKKTYVSYNFDFVLSVFHACSVLLCTLGQCLNFNCAFTLVLMLRHCITFLRTRGASSFLPLDQHIYMHKLTGMFISFYSLLHTIMHLLNLSEYLCTLERVTHRIICSLLSTYRALCQHY